MKRSCVFTLQHNEEWFLPMWIKYYGANFAPEDMYILSHNCSGVTDDILEQAEKDGIHVLRLETNEIFNHDWLLNEIHTAQRNLLKEYEYVVFSDCDEFIVTKEGTLREFMDKVTDEACRAQGIDVIGDKMFYSHGFSKTLIARVPLTWCHGYHFTTPEYPIHPNLELYHLHFLDYDQCWRRSLRLAAETWDQYAVDNRLGFQNRVVDKAEFDAMWHASDRHHIDQSDNLRRLLDFIA